MKKFTTWWRTNRVNVLAALLVFCIVYGAWAVVYFGVVR